MSEEGYIKFHCHWVYSPALNPDRIQEVNLWRKKLNVMRMIYEDDNGVGFGNISVRGDRPGEFIITGTQTGGISCLTENHYTTVTNFDWEKNYVTCEGPIEASSETLTHAALYVANPEINAVVHVHHLRLWKTLLNKVLTTSKNVAYGTPEMAQEIIRLCQESNLNEQKVLVMEGHKEGIITFGVDLEEANSVLLKYYYYCLPDYKKVS